MSGAAEQATDSKIVKKIEEQPPFSDKENGTSHQCYKKMRIGINKFTEILKGKSFENIAKNPGFRCHETRGCSYPTEISRILSLYFFSLHKNFFIF